MTTEDNIFVHKVSISVQVSLHNIHIVWNVITDQVRISSIGIRFISNLTLVRDESSKKIDSIGSVKVTKIVANFATGK